MLYFPKKRCHITPLPPHNGHLSTTATFFCPQGGRCGEVQLYSNYSACIIEGRSVGAEELKSTLGWPNLQARRNYLKCLLVHKCLHGIAPSYFLSEFRHAHLHHGYNTRSRDLLRPPFAKNCQVSGELQNKQRSNFQHHPENHSTGRGVQ